MEEFDENGWAPIHHAAYRNHVTLVERLLESSRAEKLELVTGDSLQNTPLLLAVSSGSKQMVNLLLNLGADITFVNKQTHGVIEICAIYEHVDLLRYFLNVNNPSIKVCKKLVTLLSSDREDHVLSTCSVISKMMNQSEEEMTYLVDSFVAEALVPQLVNVLKKNLNDDVKKLSLHILKCIFVNTDVKRQIPENNAIHIIISLVFNASRHLLPHLMETISVLMSEKNFAETYAVNIIPALMKAISDTNQEDKENSNDILLPVLKVMTFLAVGSPIGKDAVGKQEGLLPVLVKLFIDCQQKSLLLAWSEAVGSIAEKNTNNQNTFIRENVWKCLHQLLKSKYKDLQMSAVKTLHRLVEGNLPAQRTIMEVNGITPLIQLLKRRQSQHSQEAIMEALWALVGVDTETQRTMAARIGVTLLIEFLSTPSYKLNLIGTKGLSVLVQGPYDVRNAVASASGAHHLVRLLRSPREDVVLSAVHAVRHICVGVGYIPHNKNQTAVANSKGLKYLVALLTHCQDEHIQVEAALAIAAAVLGHSDNLGLLYKNSGFSYSHILHLLNSPNEEVRLCAGAALATFSFNSPSQQKAIFRSGGVRWSQFGPFLESDKHIYRAHAAFQLVVLARIIPDKEPSYACAAGIQTLVGLLEHSTSSDTLALTADCLARLSHTRAGLPAAMVSIGVVDMLCQLLSSPSYQVQGCSAIALSYLSFNHMAERQLLKRCREDPHLIKVLIFYNKKQIWSSTFLERWKHIRKLVLPPIR
ncbi:uncharacterized protein WCC33_009210 [Rhinophrynus dorsalis]